MPKPVLHLLNAAQGNGHGSHCSVATLGRITKAAR